MKVVPFQRRTAACASCRLVEDGLGGEGGIVDFGTRARRFPVK